MDPRYTPGSDRNSRAALFSNSVSCPKRVRMIKGNMMMALQKLPTLLMATFKLAEREMFSDRNKTASEMHVEPRIVAPCWGSSRSGTLSVSNSFVLSQASPMAVFLPSGLDWTNPARRNFTCDNSGKLSKNRDGISMSFFDTFDPLQPLKKYF